MIPTPVLEHRVMFVRGDAAELRAEEVQTALAAGLNDYAASGWRYAYTIPAGPVTFVVFTRERGE